MKGVNNVLVSTALNHFKNIPSFWISVRNRNIFSELLGKVFTKLKNDIFILFEKIGAFKTFLTRIILNIFSENVKKSYKIHILLFE